MQRPLICFLNWWRLWRKKTIIKFITFSTVKVGTYLHSLVNERFLFKFPCKACYDHRNSSSFHDFLRKVLFDFFAKHLIRTGIYDWINNFLCSTLGLFLIHLEFLKNSLSQNKNQKRIPFLKIKLKFHILYKLLINCALIFCLRKEISNQFIKLSLLKENGLAISSGMFSILFWTE